MVDREPQGGEAETKSTDPREHKGLIAKLRDMLTNPDNTDEQRAITAEHRAVQAQETADRQDLRVRALDALASESGVAPTDQSVIEAKMQEIAAADAATEEKDQSA
ncbi:hypothetical protein IT415_03990 [bacterium]|nr:hypothetical protein [bacterium]